ncbi:MAG: hypothetical protein WBA62_15385 [Xanthobacteraceae bacterium]
MARRVRRNRINIEEYDVSNVIRHARLYAGHPRLKGIVDSKAWMAGTIGERSDAVLRTAMPGHDDDLDPTSIHAASGEPSLRAKRSNPSSLLPRSRVKVGAMDCFVVLLLAMTRGEWIGSLYFVT